MLFFIMGENTVASIKLQVNCCQNTNTATRLHLNDLLEMLLCFGAAAPLVSLPCFFFSLCDPAALHLCYLLLGQLCRVKSMEMHKQQEMGL